jgi:hypothetical protein
MSLDLSALKHELQESYFRTEEVLTGMDAYISALEKRVSTLESQIDVVLAFIKGNDGIQSPQHSQIYLGPGQ